MALRYDILARSSATRARRGRVTTANGTFETPAFMPVGTRGTVKGILPGMVESTGAEIILGNTYHLMLRPGDELIERVCGPSGLHRFANWNRPILTDSGGYQAYSMADMNKVTDDGVTFKSIVDGSQVHLTPERSMQVQNRLGADIIMAFDDCPPSANASEAGADPRLTRVISRDTKRSKTFDHGARVKQANERTVRWLERCKAAHGRSGDQSLFGIVQGGTDLDQRTWSAERICGVELPGYAIGGVAVGETSADISRVVRHTAPLLPEGKPRYLMGVGYERDLLAAVLAGVDMFDCVLPTRNGRNAEAFTREGAVKLRNARHAEDGGPLEEGCDCAACSPWKHAWAGVFGSGSHGKGDDRPFSRAYIRHLFMANEMLGPILVSLHNLRYFQRFMADIRRTIETDDWRGLVGRWPQAVSGLEGVGENV